MTTIHERIIECAQSVGIVVTDDRFPAVESISSLAFVAFLVEMECEFSIEFPNEYIGADILESIDYLESVIKSLMEETQP